MPFVIPARIRGRHVLAVAAAAVTALSASASVAAAAPINPDDCVVDHALSQPFTPWGDTASYALAPAGDFESAGWDLQGGAAVVAGNQPNDLGTGGTQSLLLPAGAVATSAPMCIDDTYPHFRLFAKSLLRNSKAKAGLKAEVLFLDEDGSVQARDASSFVPARSWSPSPNLAIDVPWNVGEAAPVQFRFTATGGATQVDDVYVDPYGRS